VVPRDDRRHLTDIGCAPIAGVRYFVFQTEVIPYWTLKQALLFLFKNVRVFVRPEWNAGQSGRPDPVGVQVNSGIIRHVRYSALERDRLKLMRRQA
jgi:hypothetical protein